jgi:REP element-mobilizing transposase RayT
MTVARRTIVSLDDTPYYHCISRCVRRAFLCGEDAYSGQDFNHRRQWLVDRLTLQASLFGIDICAYAIMANHYHVVLRVNCAQLEQWSDLEVVQRWCGLFRGPTLARRYLAGDAVSEAQMKTLCLLVAKWRERLGNISWFMRCMNEFIARKANREDECKGRFWEGRFSSQALLDDTALLSCMAYVDLNPVRAGIATSLEDADFTSIQTRLKSLARAQAPSDTEAQQPAALLPFAKSQDAGQDANALPFSLRDYIELVEWTGRAARDDKRGFLTGVPHNALAETGLNPGQWLALSLEIQRASLKAIGNLPRVRRYNHSLGRRWLSGQSRLARIYGEL